MVFERLVFFKNSIKMKKLNKLEINSDRLLKNDELITLKGGYDNICCECHGTGGGVWGYLPWPGDNYTCTENCKDKFGRNNVAFAIYHCP